MQGMYAIIVESIFYVGMNILVLQLRIIKEPGFILQLETLYKIAYDKFMTAGDPDVICKDQCLTGQECFIEMILIIDDKRFPAFHIQRAIIDTVCFIPVDLGRIGRIIPSHTQIAVEHFYKGLRHVIRGRRNAGIRAG